MISTHILDTSVGDPARGVEVLLEIKKGTKWKEIECSKTNEDGRISFNCPSEIGVYRLTFDVENYYSKKAKEHFFMATPVVFNIKDSNRNYHVPLLLNPFGYSTYRGS